jgi:hypothetical protein
VGAGSSFFFIFAPRNLPDQSPDRLARRDVDSLVKRSAFFRSVTSTNKTLCLIEASTRAVALVRTHGVATVAADENSVGTFGRPR